MPKFSAKHLVRVAAAEEYWYCTSKFALRYSSLNYQMMYLFFQRGVNLEYNVQLLLGSFTLGYLYIQKDWW